MPSRASPGSYSAETRQQITVIQTGQMLTPTVYPHHLTWTNNVTLGANVPGWRQRLKSGSDATTSLVGNQSTATLNKGSCTAPNIAGWKYVNTGALLVTQGIPLSDPTTIDGGRTDAEALGRFNQAIFRARTAVEGGVFLGELGQTLQMIRSPAKGLRKLTDEFLDIARAIRRKPIRTVLGSINYAKITEHLSDAWLEAQFGWKPLISDVRDGASALRDLSSKIKFHSQPIRGHYESTVSKVVTTAVSGIGPCLWLVTDTLTGTVSVTYRGAMWIEARDPGEIDPSKFGLGPRNFLPTVWELIPYSFLIDYFTNVGDVVRGWSNLGLRLAWSNRTTRKQYFFTSTATKPQGSNPYSSFNPAKFISSRKTVVRGKYEGGLTPDLTFRVPSKDSLRWLNIAALIGSRNADRRWSYD